MVSIDNKNVKALLIFSGIAAGCATRAAMPGSSKTTSVKDPNEDPRGKAIRDMQRLYWAVSQLIFEDIPQSERPKWNHYQGGCYYSLGRPYGDIDSDANFALCSAICERFFQGCESFGFAPGVELDVYNDLTRSVVSEYESAFQIPPNQVKKLARQWQDRLNRLVV